VHPLMVTMVSTPSVKESGEKIIHANSETGDATHISRSFGGFLGAAGLAWANDPAQHGFQEVQERRVS
jgi:hypothetical protein